MMCNMKMQDTQVKDKALSDASGSISEDAATQTPRSVSESCGFFSTETPRSNAKSDESESDAESDSAPNDDEDAYRAFLRELAGSFEATGEDDDSEQGSEDGCSTDGEEEEDAPSLFRKGGEGEHSCGDAPAVVARRIGGDRGPTVFHEDGAETQKKGQHAQWKLSGSARRDSAVSVLSTASGGESTETDDDGIQRGGWLLTPMHDNRPPVEDDYNVIQALQEFAQGRPGTLLEQRREDLQAEIQLKAAQAQSLAQPANNPSSSPHVRAHYARVRADLDSLREALERELAALDKESTLSGDIPAIQAYEYEAEGYLLASEAHAQCRFQPIEDGPAVVRAC